MKKFIFFIFLSVHLIASEGEMQILQPVTSTCPKAWLDEMKSISSSIDIVEVKSNRRMKREAGVPRAIQSCNTSYFKDYVFEGNVPAQAIKDFFKNTPTKALGLALPPSENDKTTKTVYVFFENEKYKEFGKYK